MKQERVLSGRHRSGIAYIVAILCLAIFAALGVAFASVANLEVQKADNLRAATEARLAAESGLSFMLGVIADIELPASTDDSTVLFELGTVLCERLVLNEALVSSSDGTHPYTPTLTINGTGITMPEIQLPHGRFSCQIAPVVGPGGTVVYTLTVTGRAGDVTRRVAMNLALVEKRSSIFDYGVASRGTIRVKGSAALIGANSPDEAALLSTRSAAPAIVVADSATIGGQLGVTGMTKDYVLLLPDGNDGISVGGSTDPDVIMTQQVRLGVTQPRFPMVDISPFVAFAVNTVSPDKLKLETAELTNVRIAAGTNPSFQNVVINGVLYIESPNLVKFTGGAIIRGIIVTEEDSWQDPSACQIHFGGSVEAPGVEALPEGEPSFAEIRKHRGTVILAPGFGVTFLGNVEAVNGVIAADNVYFSGSSSVTGALHGAIVGLTDAEMLFSGSAQIRISGMEDGMMPAGFERMKGLSPIVSSYVEPAGS